MPNREIYSDLNFYQCIPPQIVDATTTGLDVDLQGYDACTILVETGALSSITSASYWVVRMLHADASVSGGAGTYANCTSVEMIRDWSGAVTSGIFLSLFSDTNFESTTFKVGYVGAKRYVQVVIEEKGNLSTAAFAVTAVRGKASQWPAGGTGVNAL